MCIFYVSSYYCNASTICTESRRTSIEMTHVTQPSSCVLSVRATSREHVPTLWYTYFPHAYMYSVCMTQYTYVAHARPFGLNAIHRQVTPYMSASASPLADQFTCQLCDGPYADPRILPCLHSFCRQCLQDEIDRADAKQSIHCPVCQRVANVPLGEAGLLPQNLHLVFEVEVAGYMSKMAAQSPVPCTFCTKDCMDAPAEVFCTVCCEFLCSAAHDSHKRVPQLAHHRVLKLDCESSKLLPSLVKPNQYRCSEPDHGKEELKFFCEVCKCLICRDCIVGAHKNHKVTELSTVADGHREKMRQARGRAQEVVSKLTDAAAANEKMVEDLKGSIENAERAINQAFEQLHSALEGRRITLLSELKGILLSKMAPLTNQRRQCAKLQQDIGRYVEAIDRTLQTHTDHEVMALGSLLPTELQSTLKGTSQLTPTPKEHCNVAVSVPADAIVGELSCFGSVADISPSYEDSTWASDPIAKTNKAYRIRVYTRTSKGDAYKYGGLLVEAKLCPVSDGLGVSGSGEDHGNGTYTITLTPQTVGPHELRVTMNGTHIRESPREIDVRPKRDYNTLYNAQHVINISGPYCVAVHDNGDLYVASSSHSICVFDQRSGHLKNTIGNFGTGDAKFQYPYGIAIKEGVLYVADYGNHCIQKITAQGEFINRFGQKGAGPGQLNGPMAIAVNSEDRLIVSERHNHRIQVFSQTGASLLIIDGKGSDSWAFQAPWGVALDPQECIHVVGCGSSTIKVFTPEGSFVRMYGDVKGPVGITIDDQGYSLVSEGSGNTLTIFDPQGSKVRTIGNFRWPWGVTLDLKEDGCVYVANNGTNTIVKYSL